MDDYQPVTSNIFLDIYSTRPVDRTQLATLLAINGRASCQTECFPESQYFKIDSLATLS